MKILLYNFRPLSVNLCYRRRLKGESRYRNLYNFIQSELQNFPNFDIINKPFHLQVKFYMRGKRSIDIDNCFKWFDVFNKIIWIDDSQMHSLCAEKILDAKDDICEIEILNLDKTAICDTIINLRIN